jgi:hypothetical protein
MWEAPQRAESEGVTGVWLRAAALDQSSLYLCVSVVKTFLCPGREPVSYFGPSASFFSFLISSVSIRCLRER